MRSTITRVSGGSWRRSATASISRMEPTPATPLVASTSIPVRYKDRGCMKVVYSGKYLTYFEVARVEFLRQQGLAMSEVDQLLHLPVVEALWGYKKPPRPRALFGVGGCGLPEPSRRAPRFPQKLRNGRGEGRPPGPGRQGCRVPATRPLVPV